MLRSRPHRRAKATLRPRAKLYGGVASAHLVHVDGRSHTLDQLEAVARHGARAELAPSVPPAAEATYRLNQEIVTSGATVYGVTTGVGDSVSRRVAVAGANLLQESLIRLNGCGTGPELPFPEARAVVLARANCLARGHSAVRPLLPERMLDLLNPRAGTRARHHAVTSALLARMGSYFDGPDGNPFGLPSGIPVPSRLCRLPLPWSEAGRSAAAQA
jgi:aromatic amino acid lyase